MGKGSIRRMAVRDECVVSILAFYHWGVLNMHQTLNTDCVPHIFAQSAADGKCTPRDYAVHERKEKQNPLQKLTHRCKDRANRPGAGIAAC